MSVTAGAWWFQSHTEGAEVRRALPALLLGLQNVQQELLHFARGHLVQVLGRHVPSTDLQLVLHRVDNPPEGKAGTPSPIQYRTNFSSLLSKSLFSNKMIF